MSDRVGILLLHTPFLTVALFLIFVPFSGHLSVRDTLLDRLFHFSNSSGHQRFTRASNPKYLVSFYLAKFQTADIYNQIAPACTASNYLIAPTYSESHSFTSVLRRSVLKKDFVSFYYFGLFSIYLLKRGYCLNQPFCDTKL